MKRPFVRINSAMSADGKISSIERRQIKISSPKDLERVKRLRAESDAIMVGVGTVLADDPGLKIKSPDLRNMRIQRGLSENPLRVVADSLARTPPSAKVLGDGCIIAISEAAPSERLKAIEDRCDVVVAGKDKVDLEELLGELWRRGARTLMVEGGATLNWSLIEAGLVDEISVYIGTMIIGGESAPTLVDGVGFCKDFPQLKLVSAEKLGGGALLSWRVLQ